jgi:hypothetical protein
MPPQVEIITLSRTGTFSVAELAEEMSKRRVKRATLAEFAAYCMTRGGGLWPGIYHALGTTKRRMGDLCAAAVFVPYYLIHFPPIEDGRWGERDRLVVVRFN